MGRREVLDYKVANRKVIVERGDVLLDPYETVLSILSGGRSIEDYLDSLAEGILNENESELVTNNEELRRTNYAKL